MASGNIDIDFAKAMSVANSLDEIANRIDQVTKVRFDGSMQVVSGSWQGPNADIYLRKGENLKNDIVDDAREYRIIAADLREAAKKIYEAEMASAGIATTRDY